MAYDRALPKTVGSILVAVTIVGALPRAAEADPPRVAETKLAEARGPNKKNKKKRTFEAHGFAAWTRRRDGNAFAPLPRSAWSSPAEIAVATARKQIGKPYRWGRSGPSSFDCSGLTSYVWAAAGVHLPRTSRSQFVSLPRVPLDELQPGDVVYRPGHVGIYIGKGRMIHAPQSGRRVEIAPMGRRIGAVRPG